MGVSFAFATLNFSLNTTDTSLLTKAATSDRGDTLSFKDANFTKGNGIPPEIYYLDFLKVLEFEKSIVDGELPTEIGNLRLLEVLSIANYEHEENCRGITIDSPCRVISGTIPTEIGNLKKLKTLSLRDNAFSGQVPEEISQLSLLKTLHLDRNCLSGLLPIGLTQLPNLTNFNSRQNSFEIGSYGPGFRLEDADQVPSDWITVVDGRIESNECHCYRTENTCGRNYLECPPVPPLCSRAPKGKFLR